MSVDVATGEQIQRLNIFDAKDVQQLSPGLQLTNTEGRNNNASLRGVESDPDSGVFHIDYYFNEVPIDIQTAFTAIYDIDQIEVLRGPQGGLRGRTAPAGAITLRTRRPNLSKYEGYAQVTATEDHAYNFQGAMSVPIIEGKLAVRAAMLVDHNRLNQVYNVARGEWSKSDTISGRLSLAFKPIDDLSINLTYQRLENDNQQHLQVESTGTAADLPPGAFSNRPIVGPSDYVAVNGGPNTFENETNLFTANASWDLGPVVLEGVGGIQRTTLKSQNDLDPANITPEAEVQTLKVTYPIEMAELRLLSDNPGGFFNWSVGAYYRHQGGKAVGFQPQNFYYRGIFFGPFPLSTVPFTSPGVVNFLVPIKSRAWALSGSTRFQFTEKLRLEAAARYTDTKGTDRNIVNGFVTLPTSAFGIPGLGDLQSPIASDNSFKRTAKPLTGAASLTYEASRDLTAYLAYGRSFVGGPSAVAGPQDVTDDLLHTPNETSNSVEAGVKAAFFDRRLSLNVAAFYQKYSGYITRLTTWAHSASQGDSYNLFNYGGDAKVKGLEATLSGRPTRNWDFTVAASYTKGRWDNARLPCNDFNGDGKPDTPEQLDTLTPTVTGPGNVSYCTFNGRLTNAPSFALVGNSEIRMPLGTIEPFLRGLVNYRPSVTGADNFHYSSRTLVNLFAGVRGGEGRWEVSAFVRNLLNQHKVTAIGPERIQSAVIVDLSQGFGGLLAPAAPYQSGYRTINTTVPREWGLTSTFRF